MSTEDVSKDQKMYVVNELNKALEDPELSLALAAMNVLIEVIKRSQEKTVMGLKRELKDAIELLIASPHYKISLKSGADIFMNYITRMESEISSFPRFKESLIKRGELLKAQTLVSRTKISKYADTFIQHGMVILVHGYSRVVSATIEYAMNKGKRIKRVILTESRPGIDGMKMSSRLALSQLPIELIPDSAVAHILSRVDMVLVGAEAVMENGGLINKIGTYQLAITAKTLNKPFYVAVESFKMTRMYPLSQADIDNPQIPLNSEPITLFGSKEGLGEDDQKKILNNITINSPSLDYTPPQFISLLFTDLGILTPSAVSDELLKLYY